MRFLTGERVDGNAPNAPRIKVIGAGLPRTATSSLQAALESDVFGLSPCMHMAHIIPHADREQLVLDAMRERDTATRQKILHRIFDGYAATTDFPGMMFVADLMDMYPDAAVVLNTRSNAAAWSRSIKLLDFYQSWTFRVVCFLWTNDRLQWNILHVAAPKIAKENGAATWSDVRVLDSHAEIVRTLAKQKGRKLLEWEVTDGWQPLCDFIGVPASKDGRPFPNVNDAGFIKMIQRIVLVRGAVSWLALGASVWAAVVYGPSWLSYASASIS